MKQSFEKIYTLGKPFSPNQRESMKGNIAQAEEIMKRIDIEIKIFGVPTYKIHGRGK
jgi:hypothetical protein